MRNLLSTTILALSVVACTPPGSQEAIGETGQQPIEGQGDPAPAQELGGKLKQFNGRECVSGAGSCLPDVVVKPAQFTSHQAALSEFDRAVDDGLTGDYFDSDASAYLFPALQEHSTQLTILQSGIPVHRIVGESGKRFYVATKLAKEELVSAIEKSDGSTVIEGVQVCIPIQVD